jgi:hypothetical protein
VRAGEREQEGRLMPAAEAKLTRRMAASVLALESIVLFLSTPVMIQVSDVPQGRAIAVGLGLAVLALLFCGLLRFSWGYVLGSVLQVAAIGLGLVVPTMFVLGAVFALLWAMALLLGRRIDDAKAQQDPA